MSITVTLAGVDYTIPSPGESGWGNELNAFFEAIPAAISTAGQSTETITFGANVSVAATPDGDPQGLFIGSSDSSPLTGHNFFMQPAYAGHVGAIYAYACDQTFPGGVDTATFSITKLGGSSLSVPMDSPLFNVGAGGPGPSFVSGDLLYAQVTMNVGAVTFPGRVILSVQLVRT